MAIDFENQANGKPGGVGSDLWYFFRHSRKWWLAPIVIVMFLFGLLVVLAARSGPVYLYAVLTRKSASPG